MKESALLQTIREAAAAIAKAYRDKRDLRHMAFALFAAVENPLPRALQENESAKLEQKKIWDLYKTVDWDTPRALAVLSELIRGTLIADNAQYAALDFAIMAKAEIAAAEEGSDTVDASHYFRQICSDADLDFLVLSKQRPPFDQADSAEDPMSLAEEKQIRRMKYEFEEFTDSLMGWDTPSSFEGRITELIEAANPDAAELMRQKLKNLADEATRQNSPRPEDKKQAVLLSLIAETQGLRGALLDKIFGQEQAINAFVAGYFRAQLSDRIQRQGDHPRASFLLAGPPGVGKTYLAEAAAKHLNLPYRRFDMSEYSEDEANLEFCGSDKVYRSGHAGNVTGFVSENPRCVLLFDEVEKAHLNVIYLFLQILDAGKLRDNYTDEEVSFRDAIILFTTNVGKALYDDPEISDLSSLPRKKILEALSSEQNPATQTPRFPAAICSRFAYGNVILFNRLDAHNLLEIARRRLKANCSAFESTLAIRIETDPRLPAAVLLSEGGSADARSLTGRVDSFFHEELYELFRLDAAAAAVERIQIRLCPEECGAEVRSLFAREQTPEVLLFADSDAARECGTPSTVILHVVSTAAEAEEILLTHDISVVLCDVHCGESGGEKPLNAEDIRSAGIAFLQTAKQRYGVPLYLLERQGEALTQEELLSFFRQGVHGTISTAPRGEKDFAEQLSEICEEVYRQESLLRLAAASKVLRYRTAQSLSKDKKTAYIDLVDFGTEVAPAAEDAKNLLDSASRPNLRFDDVIGASDAKRELRYFTEYLKHPAAFRRKGLRPPKGVLLYGPPGTGKTMLAKAMAGESDVTFLATEGNRFVKRFAGEGAAMVHDLFRTARKYAPAILFIDEVDAIGKERSLPGNEASGDVLTAFLTEMDGFHTDASKPVFVLAATNYGVDASRENSLDAALLRRFDRRIRVELPIREERRQYLDKLCAANPRIACSGELLDSIALRSAGMSLAELESVFDLAMRSVSWAETDRIGDEAIEEAFETFLGGEKRQSDEAHLLSTARHEAGHALICRLGGEKPSYLTIIARNTHGGYMQHGEEKGCYTKAELLHRIRTALGGRAAEIVYYGAEQGVNTGASADLLGATQLAERMICRFGMDDEIGIASFDPDKAQGSDVRARVNAILQAQLQSAIEQIKAHRAGIDALVEALLQKNYLREQEIEEILSGTLLLSAD